MKILWIIYPFCSIFILVGAGVSFWTLRGILKARAITHWPTVEATVTTIADRAPGNYIDPNEAIAAAVRLDMLGDWEAAIALFETAAQNWPEHQRSIERCIRYIHQKQALAR